MPSLVNNMQNYYWLLKIWFTDGKHIRIIQPPDSGSIYYNYKKIFSLVLMALCDSNYCFVWVDIGGYGIYSGLYKKSTLYNKLTEKKLDIPDPKPNNW